MKSTSNLVKTCSICGQQKPLSAFSQLPGLSGGVYGSICATCRKAYQEKVKSAEHESSTRSGSALTLDIKAEIAARNVSSPFEYSGSNFSNGNSTGNVNKHNGNAPPKANQSHE